MKPTLPLVWRAILLALWAILGLTLLGGTLYTGLTSYEAFTTTLLQAVHKLDWRPYFQQRVLPLGRYQVLPYVLGSSALAWLLLTPFYYNKTTYWSRLLAIFGRWSQHQQRLFWRQRSRSEWLFFSLIIGLAVVRMGYYTSQYALQYDEAWTYNHFVSNGPLVSAVSPNNNHILYTLLACLSNLLPIDGQYSLRLPVLLGGVGLLVVFYKFLRTVSTPNWALLGLAFVAFAPAASLYSLYARGYIFQLLFTVVALSASWRLLSSKYSASYHWMWWSLAHILGLYSVPTHGYVVVLLSAYLGFKGRRELSFLKAWFLANVAVVGVAALLFAPYFLTNGSQILWAAASQGPSGEALWSYQDKVADWLLWGGGRGTPVYGIWLLIIASLLGVYYYTKRQKKPLLLVELSLLFLLLPTGLNLLTGAQPPYRVWCFLSPFLGLSLVIIGQALIPYWNNKKSLLLAILLLVGGYSWRMQQHYALQWSAQLDQQVKEMAKELLEAQIQQCYVFSNYDKPLLEYYYLRQGQRLQVLMASPESKHYALFEQLPLYEAVLWDQEDWVSTPQEYAWLMAHYPVVIYEDARVQLRLSE